MRRAAGAILLFALFMASGSRLVRADDFPEVPRPGGREEIERLIDDTVRAVTYTEFVNGGLRTRRMTRDEMNRCNPSALNLDGRHYYDSIRTVNREIVLTCESRVRTGAEVRVRETSDSLCQRRRAGREERREIRRASRVRYRLSRQEDAIHVGLRIRFAIPGGVTAPRAGRMLSQARACIPQIRSVWARYGIPFDLEFDSNRSPGTSDPDLEVDLEDSVGRSNSGSYHYRGLDVHACTCPPGDVACGARCETQRQEKFCLLILHETGHSLGLHDEYQDVKCPDRQYVSRQSRPWSVMDSQWHGWDHIEFFPSHIRSVLAPLCSRR